MAPPTPDRWLILSPHLDRALGMPPAERTAWLETLSADDPSLAAELSALLRERSALSDDGFLAGTAVPSWPESSPAGQQVGDYTLATLIGQGGMGSVWLARRSDGRFEGAAAAKLLNASLMGRAGEERFRREGSILARLSHPHIAHLIDAGVSASGQPYLLLEYVEGARIDEACDAARLTVAARLRLFIDVLAAVAHAHSNLVVHRDIKPSNVLLAASGQVKLLDFGIAKLIEGDSGAGDMTALTREEGRVMTLEYAAPEQVTGGSVTTATDVYALGALLYLLLAGRHPFWNALATRPSLLKAIMEAEPPRPSDAVARTSREEPDAAAELATRRGTTPDRLRRLLKGDLDTIVGKALKKEPGERYATANAFAEDLRRVLDHQPISARPDTLRYRTARFVRRNRLAVAMSGVALLALLGGLAGTIWQGREAARQAREASRQAREAARQRDVALTHFVRAESVNEFTDYLLSDAAPGGKAVTMHELMARAETLIDKRFAAEPDVAISLLGSVGLAYHTIEETDNARRTTKRAYDASLRSQDAAVRSGAACAWALTVDHDGDSAAALRLIDAAVAGLSEDPTLDVMAATCLVIKGQILSAQGNGSAAIDALLAARDRLRPFPEAFPQERLVIAGTLANAYHHLGQEDKADVAFALTVEQLARLGQDDSTTMATIFNNWALSRAANDTLGALALQERALRLQEGADAKEDPPSILVYNRGRLLNQLARYKEAAAQSRRAHDIARRHDAPGTASVSLLALARACRGLGDEACASNALREAVAGATGDAAGPSFPSDVAYERAMQAASAGQDADAIRLLEEAVAFHAKTGSKRTSFIEALLALSQVQLHAGHAAEARQRAQAALDLATQLRGAAPRSAWVGLSQLALGQAREKEGDRAEARALYGSALEQMSTTLGASHPAVAEARARLASS